MSLLKFFLSQSACDETAARTGLDWEEDLLGHPDLASMSQRELADLPMPIPVPESIPQRQLEKCA